MGVTQTKLSLRLPFTNTANTKWGREGKERGGKGRGYWRLRLEETWREGELWGRREKPRSDEAVKSTAPGPTLPALYY